MQDFVGYDLRMIRATHIEYPILAVGIQETSYDFGEVNGIYLQPLEGYSIELVGDFGVKGKTDPLIIDGRTAVPPPLAEFEGWSEEFLIYYTPCPSIRNIAN